MAETGGILAEIVARKRVDVAARLRAEIRSYAATSTPGRDTA